MKDALISQCSMLLNQCQALQYSYLYLYIYIYLCLIVIYVRNKPNILSKNAFCLLLIALYATSASRALNGNLNSR